MRFREAPYERHHSVHVATRKGAASSEDFRHRAMAWTSAQVSAETVADLDGVDPVAPMPVEVVAFITYAEGVTPA